MPKGQTDSLAASIWDALPKDLIAGIISLFAIGGVVILSILVFAQAKELAYLRQQVEHTLYQQAIDEEHAEVDD